MGPAKAGAVLAEEEVNKKMYDWFKAPNGACIHYVETPSQNKYHEQRRAFCGLKPYKKGAWQLVPDASVHRACSVCMRKLRVQEEKMKRVVIPKTRTPIGQMESEFLVRSVERLQHNITKGVRVRESRDYLKELEDELLRRAGVPQDAKEHRVNFLQVIGPDIPLCWIPVDDVKAACLLLASFRPSDSLPLSQAQVDTVIGHLNKYIDEAVERNNRPNTFSTTMVGTWTKEEKKKK